MDKSTLFLYAGKDLGFRYMIQKTAQEHDKVASEIDPDQVADDDLQAFVDERSALDEYLRTFEFTDHTRKVAYLTGATNTMLEVLDTIEKGASLEEIKASLQAVVEKTASSGMLPIGASDDEEADLEGHLLAGAAIQIGHMAGADPKSDEVMALAESAVEQALAAE